MIEPIERDLSEEVFGEFSFVVATLEGLLVTVSAPHNFLSRFYPPGLPFLTLDLQRNPRETANSCTGWGGSVLCCAVPNERGQFSFLDRVSTFAWIPISRLSPLPARGSATS